jgi:uncharacterized protein YybS (DUF2232 family)
MSEEEIFKKSKREHKLLRRGYLFGVLFSLIVAVGGIFKSHTFYKGNILYHRDHRGLLISGIVMFIGSLIVTFLLARLYYKKKDEQNEFLRRKYCP